MLGDKLKQLRLSRHITQNDIASQLHINRGTYAHYEINKRQPDYETLKLLADYFEVSVDYLLGKSESLQKETTSTNTEDMDNSLLQKILSLSPQSRERAEEYLDMLKALEEKKANENKQKNA